MALGVDGLNIDALDRTHRVGDQKALYSIAQGYV